MGTATAAALAERGAQVTLLERHTIAHDWASSHGASRAIRHEYGADALYTTMVARSLELWQALAYSTGQDLYVPTGILQLGDPEDGHTLPGYVTMRTAGLPVEMLTPDECRTRFPAFAPDDYSVITYNPVGGFLRASTCCLALAAVARQHGAVIREHAAVVQVAPSGAGGTVTLAEGTVLQADRVIVTAGPWAPKLLPDVALPIRVSRQQVGYYRGVDPALFSIGAFPVFLAKMTYYGFPIDGPGLKIARHTFGATVDPDVPYAPDPDELADVAAWMHRTLPATTASELVFVDRCMYDLSPNEDFILDRHPDGPGVLIGSGFSGHGLKFGILIGRLLADLALGTPPEFPLERFRLSRFKEHPDGHTVV